MPLIIILNVCPFIKFELEFIFIKSMLLLTWFIIHTGDIPIFVPIILPQLDELVNIDIYVGNVILILPVEDKLSDIVTENVYDVFLFTISDNLLINDPVNVVDNGVNVWYPTCIVDPFLKILNLQLEVVYIDGGVLYFPTTIYIW